ncbi:MAG: VanZ family protein [Longimicrobiales bacterium]
MTGFTSDRERRLWGWTVAVVAAVYASAGFAGTLAGVLRRRGLLEASFALAFLCVVVAVVGSAMRRRPGGREVWVALGVTAVFGMVVVRLGVGPEERTHLFEYGLVGVLVHQALEERRGNGAAVPVPPLLAVGLTAALGWIDEGIQALLPDRVYDLRDVGVNALAGCMAVAAAMAVGQARRWDASRRGPGR